MGSGYFHIDACSKIYYCGYIGLQPFRKMVNNSVKIMPRITAGNNT